MVTSENAIGRKVYLLESDKHQVFFRVDRSKTYEVVRVIEAQVAQDDCRHFVIKDATGKEQEYREYWCIFVPDESKEEILMLQRYLCDNGIYAEVSHYSPTIPAIVVSIHWGDWKHTHLYCESLMKYIGYYEIGNRVTEESGEDSFSADHYFLRG